ncbi:MAG: hypothetical protein K8T91_02510 [Planctomycetes bacterium]|nr:hypothetical protein [Planctomycetota bacterium]
MISVTAHLACCVCLLAADAAPPKTPLDAAIEAWSQRALEYSHGVNKPDQRSSIPASLAVMHAHCGTGEKALASARDVTDKRWRGMTASALGHYLTEQEILELVKQLPDQEERDDALKFAAMAQVFQGHHTVSERLIEQISPNKRKEGWIFIANAHLVGKRYPKALSLLDKIAPGDQKERDSLEQRRRYIREIANRPQGLQKPPRDLAAAQAKAKSASNSNTATIQWCEVADIHLELGNNKECEQALRHSESAADRIDEAAWRKNALIHIAAKYDKLGASKEVGRVALKAAAIPPEAFQTIEDGLFSDYLFLNSSKRPTPLINLLVVTRNWKEAIEAAKVQGEWLSLGAAAAGNDDLLTELEKRMESLDSHAAKTFVCAGVVSGLFERKRKQLQPPAEKPR